MFNQPEKLTDSNPNQKTTNYKLVVVIPALNEAKTIGQVIDNIPKHFDGIAHTEVLVVDDGSTDATEEVAIQKGAKVVSHHRSHGVGAAFHTGVENALMMGADVIVNIDADGQFNPQDITKLIIPITSGEAGFVTATRFANAEWLPTMPSAKMWGNTWVTRLVNFITGRKFTDVSCGFRAYNRDTALRLTLFGKFTYTQETLIDAAFKDIEIVEIPLQIRGEREHGKSRVANNLWRYATKSASIMFRAARDYKPVYFFGMPGLVVALVGLGCGIFLAIHYLKTGQTYPYRSLVSVSGVLLIIGFLLMFLSMLADMQHRNRMIIEKILYLTRKKSYDREYSER